MRAINLLLFKKGMIDVGQVESSDEITKKTA